MKSCANCMNCRTKIRLRQIIGRDNWVFKQGWANTRITSWDSPVWCAKNHWTDKNGAVRGFVNLKKFNEACERNSKRTRTAIYCPDYSV